ncbi:hypothetical protein [Limosilactobacillus fermentum]
MVAWFFWLATVITGAFLAMAIVLLICQWVIYFRVEKNDVRAAPVIQEH